jgi:serine/threonine-protein kinase
MDDHDGSGGPLTGFDPLASDLPPAGSQPLGLGKEQVLAGRYRLGDMLSVGGVGAVYDAVDLTDGRPVVVKLLQWWEDDRRALARFRNEAEAARALAHPNIVEVLDIRESDGVCYFVMEKIAGDDLAVLLKGGKKLPLPKVAAITEQLVSALSAVHAAGVVHRDLKPGNVIVDGLESERPTVKLIDFGVAKILGGDQRLTGQGHVLGALGYMPPEQASGESSQADLRSDIYALGAIVYRMITGRAPIQGKSVIEFADNVLTKKPDPLRKHAPVSREVESVVLRSLAKKPEDRYPSMADFWSALSSSIR